jgi:hypothetical protein
MWRPVGASSEHPSNKHRNTDNRPDSYGSANCGACRMDDGAITSAPEAEAIMLKLKAKSDTIGGD